MLPLGAFRQRGSVIGGKSMRLHGGGYEPTEEDMRLMDIYYAARDAGLSQKEAQQVQMQAAMEATYSAPPVPVADVASYTPVESNWTGTPTVYANDQGVQAVLTQNGYVAPSSLNPIVKPGETITANTPVQAVNEEGLKLYLSDPNDPNSTTTRITGTPAIGGTIGSAAYAPARNNSIFGTIGGDLLEAAKDPYFHKFLAAAAAIAGGGMALNSAYGVGGLGAELGAATSGLGGYAGAGAGEFIAADAAASAAGQGAFDLAASLGMPLDQAVTSGLISGSGALTDAGALALLGEGAAGAGGMSAADALTAASAGELGSEFGVQGAIGSLGGLGGFLSGLTGSQLASVAKLGIPAIGALVSGVRPGATTGASATGQLLPTSSMNYVPATTSGGGALPGNLQSTALQGVAVPQYDPFASYDNLPQIQPIAAAEGGGATQLAQMQQQISQIDPRLYRVLQNRVAPTFYTYGKDTGGTPTQLMADKLGSKPSPGYPSQASSLTRSPLYDTYGLRPPTTAENEATPSSVTFKDGGDVHMPEFITGATGHYVKGRGDGQSDDIPAMLADGEYVFDAETVAQLGNGSSDAGAHILDKMREAIRAHKRSAAIDEIPPKSKSPLEYLAEGMKGKKV